MTTDSLLTKSQVARAVPGRTWRVTGTDPAQHSALPCQRRKFADPKATTALVRNFTTEPMRNKPAVAAVQTIELSKDVAGSRPRASTPRPAGSPAAPCRRPSSCPYDG